MVMEHSQSSDVWNHSLANIREGRIAFEIAMREIFIYQKRKCWNNSLWGYVADIWNVGQQDGTAAKALGDSEGDSQVESAEPASDSETERQRVVALLRLALSSNERFEASNNLDDLNVAIQNWKV